MKVLVAGGRFDRSEKALFKGLVEAGCELDVVFDPDAPEYELFDGLGVSSEGMSFSSRLDLSAIRSLRVKIEAGQYDIVHSLTNRALSNSLFASRGLKVKHVCYRGTIGHLSRWDPASWITYLNPKVDRIICVSNAVRDYLRRLGISDCKLKTIYKGHDVAWYQNGAVNLPADLGVPEHAFVVGYAGGLRPVKGLEYLIESAVDLDASKNIHYLLMGEGRLEVKLKRLASRLGVVERVHFVGFRNDATSLIGVCDIVVMPSVAREGLPRGVIEAMAQGVPAVVTKVGGMPEIVVDGESGIVVDNRNAAVLAEAINRLADNKEMVSKYGVAAKNRIATDFNIRDTIDRTLKLYEEVVDDKK